MSVCVCVLSDDHSRWEGKRARMKPPMINWAFTGRSLFICSSLIWCFVFFFLENKIYSSILNVKWVTLVTHTHRSVHVFIFAAFIDSGRLARPSFCIFLFFLCSLHLNLFSCFRFIEGPYFLMEGCSNTTPKAVKLVVCTDIFVTKKRWKLHFHVLIIKNLL